MAVFTRNRKRKAKPAKRALRFEGLELRQLMTVSTPALGNEFHLSAPREQFTQDLDTDGNSDGHVISAWGEWDDLGGGVDRLRVMAKHDTDLIEIESLSPSLYGLPAFDEYYFPVAIDEAGDFIVLWSIEPTTTYFARFDHASNTPERTGTLDVDGQVTSADMAADGTLTVVWKDENNTGYLFAQQFDTHFGESYDPETIDDPIQVNNTLSTHYYSPAIAVNQTGQFAVTWREHFGANNEAGIYARLFTESGTPVIDQTEVNTVYSTPYNNRSDIGIDETGAFVVTWGGVYGLEDTSAIFARRYDSDGDEIDVQEFIVNTNNPEADIITTLKPRIAENERGDFIVTWKTHAIGNSEDRTYIEGNVFSYKGISSGEFQVNQYFYLWSGPDGIGQHPGWFAGPANAIDADGKTYVTWTAWGTREDNEEIYGGIIGRKFDYILTPPYPTTEVVGRYVFYNNSLFDTSSDDDAIATDKSALISGTGSGSNVTNYSKGINGIMVDIKDADLGLPGGLANVSFILSTGIDGDYDGDLDSLDELDSGDFDVVGVRAGEGVGGSDRVTITIDDGLVKNEWLQVVVVIGGVVFDTFYFGNLVGDANADLFVNQLDSNVVSGSWQAGPVAVTYGADVNHDQYVNQLDLNAISGNWQNNLASITV